MSPALEKLVRPFQSGSIRPGSLTVGLQGATPDAVILMCGSTEGASKFFNESRSESIDSYTVGQQQEVDREVVPVRVHNEDDPDQHVDMDVTTKVTVANKDAGKVTKNEINYAPVFPTTTTEILSTPEKRPAPAASGGWPTSWNK